MSGDEATRGLAAPLDLCFAENHGHHLQKEEAVADNTFSLRSWCTNYCSHMPFDWQETSCPNHPEMFWQDALP